MTVRLRKEEARQGEKRSDQQKVFFWSMILAVVTLGVALGITLAVT